METRTRIVECDNVNGVKLSLKIQTGTFKDSSNISPKSRQFTITFKSETIQNRNTYSRTSLFFAVLLNIAIFSIIRTSLTSFIYMALMFSFLALFWVTHSVQSETLIVIPTVGIQCVVKYVWGKKDNFITWNSVDDVIINEVIKMNRVLFYLTVLIKPKTELNPQDTVKLAPLFPNTQPKLVMIEKIYEELQILMREIIKDQTQASGDKILSTSASGDKE